MKNTVTTIEFDVEIRARAKGRALVINGELQDVQIDGAALAVRADAVSTTVQQSPIESLLTALAFRQ